MGELTPEAKAELHAAIQIIREDRVERLLRKRLAVQESPESEDDPLFAGEDPAPEEHDGVDNPPVPPVTKPAPVKRAAPMPRRAAVPPPVKEEIPAPEVRRRGGYWGSLGEGE